MTFKGHFSLFVIPTSNIWEIYEIKIDDKKSCDSFQAMRLSITLAIFQGH